MNTNNVQSFLNAGEQLRAGATACKDVNIDIYVGTCFQADAELSAGTTLGLTLVFDVKEELQQLHFPNDSRFPVLAVELGENETSKTLARKWATPEELRAIEDLPNCSLADGMAAIPALGAFAMQDVLQRHYMQTLFENLSSILLGMAAGQLERLGVNVRTGSAGGIGCRAAPIAAAAVVGVLLADTSAVIDLNVSLIGAISYQGPGFRRTDRNSAASLLGWLDFSRQLPSDRVNVTITASEIIPVGIDKKLRAQLLLDQQSALFAPMVQAHLRQVRSNQAADGAYGNIRLLRTSHATGLTQTQIAAEMAQAYLPVLRKITRERAATNRIVDFDFEYRSKKDTRRTVEEILNHSLRSGAVSDLIDMAVESIGLRAIPKIHLDDQTQLDLSQVREFFVKPVQYPRDACQRVGLLRAAIALVSEEIQMVDDQHHEYLEHFDNHLDETEYAFETLLRKPVNSRLHASMLIQLESLRAVADSLAETEAELSALLKAKRELGEQLDTLLVRFERLKRAVGLCLKGHETAKETPLIIPMPLKHTMARLLNVADSAIDPRAATNKLLSQMVAHVTLAGLAKLTCARSVSVEGVVAEVESREKFYEGPSWGGAEREGDCVQFTVYPPVEPALWQVIRERHQALKHGVARIGMTESAAGSVNIVNLELRACRVLEDFFTKFYQHGLEELLADDARALYLDDLSILQRVGIQTTGSVYPNSTNESE